MVTNVGDTSGIFSVARGRHAFVRRGFKRMMTQGGYHDMDKTTKNCRTYRSEDNDSTPCHLHSAAPRLLYDRKEAARQLSISIRSLDYAIASKKLETRRNGTRVLVTH